MKRQNVLEHNPAITITVEDEHCKSKAGAVNVFRSLKDSFGRPVPRTHDGGIFPWYQPSRGISKMQFEEKPHFNIVVATPANSKKNTSYDDPSVIKLRNKKNVKMLRATGAKEKRGGGDFSCFIRRKKGRTDAAHFYEHHFYFGTDRPPKQPTPKKRV